MTDKQEFRSHRRPLGACLDPLAEPIAAMLLLIEKRHPPRTTRALAEFVAALANAHSRCCLGSLQSASDEIRQTALELVAYCFTQGLTVDERYAMLVWVHPHLLRPIR